jgi:uncharacterized repeat protein (TIGR03803 family)
MYRVLLPGAFAAFSILLSSTAAQPAGYKVLHAFSTAEGSVPSGGLIMNKGHILYGATETAGPKQGGTVFSLARDGTLAVLHAFGNDGLTFGRLTQDKTGNLYGVTQGGDSAFELALDGTETVLHSFGKGADGDLPYSGMIIDKEGNLYGTTAGGGTGGCGTVFKISPDGTESVLYNFQCDVDGGSPQSSLFLKSGALYGTTSEGGAAGAGTVFKVSLNGNETVIYSFTGGDDGKLPEYGAPIMDQAGKIYGVASQGGASRCGTIYQISPNGTFALLHAFTKSDGCNPDGGLIADATGGLYGTTKLGRLSPS